jgi:hypothetical protein
MERVADRWQRTKSTLIEIRIMCDLRATDRGADLIIVVPGLVADCPTAYSRIHYRCRDRGLLEDESISIVLGNGI